ncbi:TIGR02646 family protein [Pseudomonas sp. URIL14HWK12:I8]|uniref:HNH endonuclease n=1 Tax=unclassified Pseudomonas TaxID=196821 RepID=UPI000B7650E1|nr:MULTISPECIES: hypothetical protein [unclassified Pseudomonas]SNB79894.1 TIGR02646 family protein [Pseudomonas sp. URIL14HWK12:I8]
MSGDWVWLRQIHSGFSPSAAEHQYLKETSLKEGFSHLSWDKIQTNRMKAIKLKMYKQLSHSQHHNCAYCGLPFLHIRGDREHILPKEEYLKLIFHPYNIVLACIRCNRNVKGSHDWLKDEPKHRSFAVRGITSKYYRYKSWHPFFHDPKNHFEFSGTDNYIIKGISDEGKHHVSFFRLDKGLMLNSRLETIEIIKKRKASRDQRLLKAVQETLAYRAINSGY